MRTGYDKPPPKASLAQYPVCEANGSIYVWWHALGLPPQWEVPVFPMDDRQPYSHDTFDIAGHPQDVIENAFDWGHLPALHGLKVSTSRALRWPGNRPAPSPRPPAAP
ncbi:hypothetical protein ACFQ10_10585 [Streptomyces indonesiensis]